jgi:steroid delta-isomerase-like uncharacterized protein
MDGKESTRRFIEAAWNQGLVEQARELLAPDFVNHTPFNPAETRDEFLARIGAFRQAFLDLRMTVDEMLADGDRVITRWSATGTHEGEFRGIAPTGKTVTVTGIAIDRVVDGKRVEGWAEIDTLGLLLRLGATIVPPA